LTVDAGLVGMDPESIRMFREKRELLERNFPGPYDLTGVLFGEDPELVAIFEDMQTVVRPLVFGDEAFILECPVSTFSSGLRPEVQDSPQGDFLLIRFGHYCSPAFLGEMIPYLFD
jgi:hypothetical protein